MKDIFYERSIFHVLTCKEMLLFLHGQMNNLAGTHHIYRTPYVSVPILCHTSNLNSPTFSFTLLHSVETAVNSGSLGAQTTVTKFKVHWYCLCCRKFRPPFLFMTTNPLLQNQMCTSHTKGRWWQYSQSKSLISLSFPTPYYCNREVMTYFK